MQLRQLFKLSVTPHPTISQDDGWLTVSVRRGPAPRAGGALTAFLRVRSVQLEPGLLARKALSVLPESQTYVHIRHLPVLNCDRSLHCRISQEENQAKTKEEMHVFLS